MKARQVASLFGTLKMDDAQFKKSLADGRSGVADLGSRLKDARRSADELGSKMTGLGFAILAPLGLATKAAIDFEYAFSDVVKTVDATDAELAGLNSTIRDMASNKENPLSSLENAHETLAQIMASGGQLGVATKDLVAFTETIGALSVATNLTAEQGATQLAQFANVVGMSADDFDNFAGALVRLGNNGASTEADIMALTSRIASAGDRAGLSEQQILAFSNTLTSMGISAELGGTNFSKFINTMTTGVATGGEHLNIFAAVAGQSASDFKESFETDAAGAITTFLEGLGKLDPAEQMRVLDDLGLTGEEVGRIILSLAGNTELLTQSLEDAAAGWSDANDHLKEAEAKAATTQGAMNRLQNQLTDLGIEVGNALLPAFNDILEVVSPIVTEFSEWIAQNPELILAVGAAGTALVGMGLALKGLAIAGAALAVILSPISAIIIGIGAAIALVNTDGFQAWGENLQNAWLILQYIVDGIRRTFSMFALDLQLRILDFVSSIRQTLVDFTITNDINNLIPDVDIAPNINLDRAKIRQQILDMQSVDIITADLQSEIASGDINLDVGSIVKLTTDPASLADNSSMQFRTAVTNGLELAAANMDEVNLKNLIPVAIHMSDNPTVDMDAMFDNIADEMGYSAAARIFEFNIPHIRAAGVGEVDIQNLLEQLRVQHRLQEALDVGDVPQVRMLVDTAAELRVPHDEIQAQLLAELTQAIGEGDVRRFNALVPIATTLGIDTESLRVQMNTTIQDTDFTTTTTVPLGTDLMIDGLSLINQVVDAIQTQDYSTFTTANLALTLGIDENSLIGQVKTAIESQSYDAQVQAAVDVFVEASVHVGGTGPTMLPYDPADGFELGGDTTGETPVNGEDSVNGFMGGGRRGGSSKATSNQPQLNFAAGAIVIHANGEAEGRAAARGFADELEQKIRSRG